MEEFSQEPQQPSINEVTEVAQWGANKLDLSRVQNAAAAIRRELAKVVIGQSELVELLTITVFCEGHVLLEGVPGIAKTLSAKLLAKTIHAEFGRIQFTPDLMPSDVVGTMVFNTKTSDFYFNAGPIFSNIVLIDEINRAPAKTQSALFEVMEERQVTVDGKTYPMTYPFFVIATQNPIEQEGTYKLPEAQLDRFMFKINITYPSLSEEQRILRLFKEDFRQTKTEEVNAILTSDDIRACQSLIERVHIREELLDYIAAIVHNTRNNGDIYLGASPRASLAILKTSKAVAAMAGRDFVIPEDIQFVAFSVLNHRIILSPEREMEGYATRDVIAEIIKKIDVPR